MQSAYGPILAQAGGIGNRNRLSAKATQTLSSAWAEAQRLYGFFGKRRKKAAQACAKQYQTLKRQRADFQHKTARLLVQTYDVIYLEDLSVSNMVRTHRLAKSISDAGWAQFRSTLAYKAACAGKRVVAVPPRYTSQDCSGCGKRVPKSLSVRTHVCPSCGLVVDRDENAARNIFGAGQALRGAEALAAVVKRESIGL